MRLDPVPAADGLQAELTLAHSRLDHGQAVGEGAVRHTRLDQFDATSPPAARRPCATGTPPFVALIPTYRAASSG